MSTQHQVRVTTQIHRIYIKATAEAVWTAITAPEWTQKYGYGGIADYELKPGGRAVQLAGPGMQAAGVSGPVVDGEIIESDPPVKLVLTFRMLMDPGLVAEGFTRLTYEITDQGAWGVRLTVVHELDGAPGLASLVNGDFADSPGGGGGGWPWVLSDLKSLLETGEPMAGTHG
jgi:uncharacterized protein YndB with AHSA1/START domain